MSQAAAPQCGSGSAEARLSDADAGNLTISTTVARRQDNKVGVDNGRRGSHASYPTSPVNAPKVSLDLPPPAPKLSENTDGKTQAVQPDSEANKQYRDAVHGLRNKISALREKALRSRLRARQHRKELRQQRGTAGDADAELMKAISASFAQGAMGVSESIKDLLERSRAARDVLGPLEDTYNETEDELDTAEFFLETAESQLYGRYKALEEHPAFEELSHHRSAPSSSYVSSIVSDATDGFPTSEEIELFLSKVRESNMIRERLEELLEERADYLDRDRARSSLGVKVERFHHQFLDRFNPLYNKGLDQLELIDSQAINLRQECVDKGLLSADDMVYHRKYPAMLLAPFIGINRYRLPGLFSPFTSRFEYLESFHSGFGNTRDRINRWLLDRFRSSPLETARYKADLNDDLAGEGEWSGLVMEFWPRDEAAQAGSLSIIESDVQVMSVAPPSRHSTDFNMDPVSPSQTSHEQGQAQSLDSQPVSEPYNPPPPLIDQRLIDKAKLTASKNARSAPNTSEGSQKAPSPRRWGLGFINETLRPRSFIGFRTSKGLSV